MGTTKLAGIASEDIGACTYGIFKRGDPMIGKTVGIAGDHTSGADMAATLTKALGREVRYNEVSPEAYRGFGFPGAEDLGNMFQYYRDFPGPFLGARKLDESRALNPQLQDFATWVTRNKEKIPLA